MDGVALKINQLRDKIAEVARKTLHVAGEVEKLSRSIWYMKKLTVSQKNMLSQNLMYVRMTLKALGDSMLDLAQKLEGLKQYLK